MDRNRDDRTDSEEAAANRAAGKWNQVKGNVKEAWGEVTNDPKDRWEGKLDRIKGRMQEEYGKIKQKESEIELDVDDFDDRV